MCGYSVGVGSAPLSIGETDGCSVAEGVLFVVTLFLTFRAEYRPSDDTVAVVADCMDVECVGVERGVLYEAVIFDGALSTKRRFVADDIIWFSSPAFSSRLTDAFLIGLSNLSSISIGAF